MRTLSLKLKDAEQNRYAVNSHSGLEPTTRAEAALVLRSAGGSKIAKIAIKHLWDQSTKEGGGWLPTAVLEAPARVLKALELVGVIEQALDMEERDTIAWRYRLTELGLQHAIQALGIKP